MRFATTYQVKAAWPYCLAAITSKLKYALPPDSVSGVAVLTYIYIRTVVQAVGLCGGMVESLGLSSPTGNDGHANCSQSPASVRESGYAQQAT
jgi:hypothetical protein